MISTNQIFKVLPPYYSNCLRIRSYASSRFGPKRVAGVGRTRSRLNPYKHHDSDKQPVDAVKTQESDAFSGHNNPRIETFQAGTSGLEKLLLQSDTLIIERQLEMLNVFIGFEQSNKYTIRNDRGEPVGYIAEESTGFLSTISRQIFATHRPFRAVIMDQQGLPILWIRRPFAWINSRMFVQRLKEEVKRQAIDAEPPLESFGEVQQIWHPWRRQYDLFLRENLSDVSVLPTKIKSGLGEASYYQIGKVDSGFLSWQFHILNQHGNIISTVDRAFRGFGREIFTDTGRYSIHFKPSALSLETQLPGISSQEHHGQSLSTTHELDIDTRALLLSLAVNIDFDYFSRHSRGGGLFHITTWE